MFFNDNIIHAFGWSLIHSLWQGTVISLLLAVLMIFASEKHARFRYNLAISGMTAMFMVWLGTFFYLVQKEAHAATAVALQAFSVEGAAQLSLLARSEIYFQENLPLVVTFWLAGCLILSLRFLGSLAWSRRLRRFRVNPAPQYWQNQLKNMCRRMGITRSVTLLESALVNSPMVIGHLKPVILIPIGAITGLSQKELEGLLLHELGHIARNDYVVNMFISMLEILFFYHPAIWWISDLIHREREHCCDDIALSHFGDPLTLAKALAHLQEVNMNTPTPAMAAIGKKHHLLNRIKRMTGGNLLPSTGERMLTGLALIFCLVCLSFSATAMVAPPQEDSEINYSSSHGKFNIHRDAQGQITKILINGEPVDESEWPRFQKIFDDMSAQEAIMREQEKEIQAIEVKMREQEAKLHEEDGVLAKTEEVMAKVEAQMREHEAQMKDHEAVFETKMKEFEEKRAALRESGASDEEMKREMREFERSIRDMTRGFREKARDARRLARENQPKFREEMKEQQTRMRELAQEVRSHASKIRTQAKEIRVHERKLQRELEHLAKEQN